MELEREDFLLLDNSNDPDDDKILRRACDNLFMIYQNYEINFKLITRFIKNRDNFKNIINYLILAEIEKVKTEFTRLQSQLTKKHVTIAFMGSSNCGKSSLINKLFGSDFFVGANESPSGKKPETFKITEGFGGGRFPEYLEILDSPSSGVTESDEKLIDFLLLNNIDSIVWVHSVQLLSSDSFLNGKIKDKIVCFVLSKFSSIYPQNIEVYKNIEGLEIKYRNHLFFTDIFPRKEKPIIFDGNLEELILKEKELFPFVHQSETNKEIHLKGLMLFEKQIRELISDGGFGSLRDSIYKAARSTTLRFRRIKKLTCEILTANKAAQDLINAMSRELVEDFHQGGYLEDF